MSSPKKKPSPASVTYASPTHHQHHNHIRHQFLHHLKSSAAPVDWVFDSGSPLQHTVHDSTVHLQKKNLAIPMLHLHLLPTTNITNPNRHQFLRRPKSSITPANEFSVPDHICSTRWSPLLLLLTEILVHDHLCGTRHYSMVLLIASTGPHAPIAHLSNPYQGLFTAQHLLQRLIYLLMKLLCHLCNINCNFLLLCWCLYAQWWLSDTSTELFALLLPLLMAYFVLF